VRVSLVLRTDEVGENHRCGNGFNEHHRRRNGFNEHDWRVSSSVSEEEAPLARAETRCDVFFDCCDPTADHGDVMLPVYEFADIDECVEAYRQHFQSIHDAAKEAGIVYNPECLDTTLAIERYKGCSDTIVGGPACATPLYTGDVPEGGQCMRGIAGVFDNCQAGLICETTATVGTCAARTPLEDQPYMEVHAVEIGEPCVWPAVCGPDAFCSGDVCQPHYALGEACTPFLCSGGLYCHPDTETCVAALPAGSSCELGWCERGTHCPTWEEDADTRVCTENIPDGQACTVDSQCNTGWCSEVCAERPATVCLTPRLDP
jgi:hypothetical protein